MKIKVKKGWGVFASVLVLVLIAPCAFSQPSIAFLDAIIDPGVDVSVQSPVTEIIIQELVLSGEYTVLDRLHVSRVLEEREFQLSGLVRDEDIKEAGAYIGADFVGVSRISRVGATYFISGKIINVETGAIAAQTSGRDEGDIEVVLAIAADVGSMLAGGRVESIPEEHQAAIADYPKEVPYSVLKASPRVVASLILPLYRGDLRDFIEKQHEDAFGSDAGTISGGIDLHVMHPVFSVFYVSGGLTAAGSNVSDGSDSYKDFRTYDFRALAGAVYPVMEKVQVYGGLGLGMMFFTWQSGSDGFWADKGSESGLAVCFEAGADFFPGRIVAIGVKTQYVTSALKGDYADGHNLGYLGISVGGGIRY